MRGPGWLSSLTNPPPTTEKGSLVPGKLILTPTREQSRPSAPPGLPTWRGSGGTGGARAPGPGARSYWDSAITFTNGRIITAPTSEGCGGNLFYGKCVNRCLENSVTYLPVCLVVTALCQEEKHRPVLEKLTAERVSTCTVQTW